MATDRIKSIEIGNDIELSRKQWKGHVAMISNYPGLMKEISKYTWTYSGKEHPYLQSSKLGKSLHRFVLEFLYGQDALEKMLQQGNIIEHLDNDGLNCTYENLHILSSDFNKAKAFTIDNQMDKYQGIPSFITDIYYSHNKNYYQMQITFNKNIYFATTNDITAPIEAFFFQYQDFEELYMDWLYVFRCRQSGLFDVRKFHHNQWKAKFRPQIRLMPEERDNIFIERNGKRYLILNTEDKEKMVYLSKTTYVNLEEL